MQEIDYIYIFIRMNVKLLGILIIVWNFDDIFYQECEF